VSFSRPDAIFVCASPEATFCALTNTGLPPTVAPEALKRRTSGTSSFSFSGE
jgi:hypothetical protein